MRRTLALAAGLAGAVVATAAEAQPRVVASILPLQSLAASVMEGVAEPAAIIRSTGTPHSYSLRPSEARLIREAEVIVWLGPDYENFLTKPLAALAGQARIVALMKAPGIVTLPAREGGSWDSHGHGHGHAHKPGAAELDAHVFLDPENAKAIVRVLAETLAAADGANRSRYEANARATLARLDGLDAELRATLASVRGVPYVVFHDGYQYFEKRYGLNAVGSITVSPERAPGARRLGELRRKIDRLKAVCVFAEPQFASALIGTVSEGTQARTGTLDYIGVSEASGPGAYFAMMRGLARSLVGCLAG